MRNWVLVRPLDNSKHPKDGEMFLGWAKENEHGEFDPAVALFPSSFTWCAYDKDGPLAFQTIQQPFMLETLAFRPGATHRQKTVAIRELTHNAIAQASLKGAGEVYFVATEEGTNDLADSQMFEELPWRVFRAKIRDLEG